VCFYEITGDKSSYYLVSNGIISEVFTGVAGMSSYNLREMSVEGRILKNISE